MRSLSSTLPVGRLGELGNLLFLNGAVCGVGGVGVGGGCSLTTHICKRFFLDLGGTSEF